MFLSNFTSRKQQKHGIALLVLVVSAKGALESVRVVRVHSARAAQRYARPRLTGEEGSAEQRRGEGAAALLARAHVLAGARAQRREQR